MPIQNIITKSKHFRNHEFGYPISDGNGGQNSNQPYKEKDWKAQYTIGFKPYEYHVFQFKPFIGYFDEEDAFTRRDVDDYDKKLFPYLPGGILDNNPIKILRQDRNKSFVFSIDASDYHLGFLSSDPKTGIPFSQYEDQNFPGLLDGHWGNYHYTNEQDFWDKLKRFPAFTPVVEDDKRIYNNRFTVLYIAQPIVDENIKRNIQSFIPKPNNASDGWDVMLKLIAGRIPKRGGKTDEFVEVPELFPCMILCDIKSGKFSYTPAWMGPDFYSVRIDQIRDGKAEYFHEFPTDIQKIKKYIPPQYHSLIDINRLLNDQL